MANRKGEKSAKVAVIGSGYWGKNLVRNYKQIGALKLICERNETLLQHFKKMYPDVETCVAYNDVLSREDIDAIVIATPAETHYNLAREALLAGKHTYIEKPLALDEENGEELILLARKNKKTLNGRSSTAVPSCLCYIKRTCTWRGSGKN